MNRRAFFGSLAAVLAAASAPQIFLPRDPVRWKRTQTIWVPNPEYATAQYEVYFVDQPALFDQIILEKFHTPTGEPAPLSIMEATSRVRYPMRFKDRAAIDRLEEVPPFIPA